MFPYLLLHSIKSMDAYHVFPSSALHGPSKLALFPNSACPPFGQHTFLKYRVPGFPILHVFAELALPPPSVDEVQRIDVFMRNYVVWPLVWHGVRVSTMDCIVRGLSKCLGQSCVY